MVPPRTLEGKVAIVTGAARGIGRQIALDLASRGARVLFTYSSDSSRPAATSLVDLIANSTNSTAFALQSDIRSATSASDTVSTALSHFGPHIDILVNNAAIMSVQSLGEITAEQFEDVFAVNFRGPLMLTQAVLPHLRRPGRIINISSVAARIGIPGLGLYSGSKGALEALTRTWAAELGGDGTTVNAVNPGPVESDMLPQVPEVIVSLQRKMTPVEHRVGLPQEIAEVVAFLAEERSSWVSGQCLSVSGGFDMY